MDNGKIYTSTLRLYKSRPEHNQAYEHLMQRDKDTFKSMDNFIAEAIIYFSQHLNKEQEKSKMQELGDAFAKEDSPVVDFIRNIIKEVLDEKLMEFHGEVVVPDSGSTENIGEEPKCTDLDKRFADFYNYD